MKFLTKGKQKAFMTLVDSAYFFEVASLLKKRTIFSLQKRLSSLQKSRRFGARRVTANCDWWRTGYVTYMNQAFYSLFYQHRYQITLCALTTASDYSLKIDCLPLSFSPLLRTVGNFLFGIWALTSAFASGCLQTLNKKTKVALYFKLSASLH